MPATTEPTPVDTPFSQTIRAATAEAHRDAERSRYLGDLSGGLFIRQGIERVYGIDETSGTAFYDFPKVPDPVAWKDAYRRRLDAAPWDPDERARITAEILEAYLWNTQLLEQLGG